MSHITRLIPWPGAVLVLLTTLMLLALGLTALPASGEQAARFRSSGDLIAGWYWLRDDTASGYAEYTFPNPPAQGDILIDIRALATDRVNGGPGVNAWFDFLVGFPGSGNMGGVFHRTGVTLQNVGGDANGYMNHGMLRLNRSMLEQVMPANGELFIRIVRSSARAPHVAFRADSVQIVTGGTLGGGTLGGSTGGGLPGDIVIDQQGTTANGSGGPGDGTVTPPDGVVTDLRPDLGDHGDQGQCFLDRPCLGATADGFRSSGYQGAEGWFWLRSPVQGQSAEYLFEHPPAGRDLVLDIAVLGQNVVGMTPTDTVHVNLVLGYPGSGSLGGQIGPIAIELPKLWMGPDEDIWRARALLRLSREDAKAVIPAVGGLFVSFTRIDAGEPDVAFSAGSVLLYSAQNLSR